VHPAVGVVISYLAGSIPAAYIAGRARGLDLRQHGSGNLGATNVIRILGPRIGLLVLAFDAAKGAAPVALLPRWTAAAHLESWAIVYGVAAIIGHVRPIFLLGRGGGKGVATAAGVFLALAPVAMLVTLAVFGTIVYATGYVSLGSLVSALVLPALLAATRGVGSPVFVVSALVAAFVFWTHRANIGRLRRGEEHGFGRRRGGPASAPGSASGAAPVEAPGPGTGSAERRSAPRPPWGRRRAPRPPGGMDT
jgi:acyl phosphate:glycerol-3-phosphate acyltransferase